MKPRKQNIRSLTLITVFATSAALHAAPVIDEPFAQTAGNLNGKAGGTGLGNWTADATTVTVANPATMIYGQLAETGGQVNLANSGATSARVTTTTVLADNGLLANGATLWFSMVFMKTTGGGSNEWAGFALGTSYLVGQYNGINMQSSGNGVGFATRNNAVNVATWLNGGNASQGGALALTYSAPALIVGKIQWGATDGDVETITLYKQDMANIGAALTGGVTKTVTGFDQTALNVISFSTRGGAQTHDEIRFGASQADVLPVDTVAPTLLSITDDKAGGPIGEDVAAVTYSLTFNKQMDITSITDADFDNVGTATTMVGTVTQASPAVIKVQLLPTTTGTLQLRIPSGSVLKSVANLDLDTTAAILDDAIIINAGTTSPNTPTSNRWWDGPTTTGVTDGVSQGGAGTWDNATTTNWDRGPGFENPIAWDNAGGNTAVFGGTAGTVTLDGNITLDGLTVNLPAAGGSPYSIGSVGEDNTLTFSGAKTVTVTATGDNTNQDTIIRAGIAGSPTMNIASRLKNSVDSFSLLPGSSVTQMIGTLNMLNTFASNKRLILGGESTGNVVDDVTWNSGSNQLMLTKAGTASWTINQDVVGNTSASRLYVEQGTLTLRDTAKINSPLRRA